MRSSHSADRSIQADLFAGEHMQDKAMTSTAKLRQSLYAAQRAWKIKRRKGGPDTSTRDMVAFVTHVARQKPNGGATVRTAKAQIARISRKAPQVMVKVSKGTFGAKRCV